MKFQRWLTQNSSTILTCMGAAGVIATAVLAVKETPKALALIERAGYEKGSDENPIEDMEYTPLTAIETIKVAWKCYIPAAGVGIATIACIFGANTLNKRQQAALMSAYALLDQTYKEYKSKVKEVLGEEAEQKVEDKIAEEKVSDICPADGKLLFYEPNYGQGFERTMLEVQDAEYRLNQKFAVEGEASLNDFFELLGLNKTDTGDLIGWSQEMAWDNYNYTWIEFEHELKKTEGGREYYQINMPFPPTFGYFVPF